ncbi:hypothetical protein FPV67DRAFT_1529699 [Lyophyllum atratum]|nr:hypothetical protein FPV67DRAFT_1529699 [Lyophyllum atratum]
MDVLQGDGRATAFSSTPTREAAYIRIQEEIRPWNRYHNELSLVSRLPPELLAAVFKYNVGMDVPSNLDWIRVSHVCSHWRRVALACPRLWTTIPFHRPRWAEEMLARSKMAPLIIGPLVFLKSESWHPPHLSSAPCAAAPLVKATMSQLSRIKKLALHQGHLGEESFMEIVSLLDSPAPLLETLEISFYNRLRAENRLPDHLFSGDAPRLSHLLVDKGILNWKALPFTHLKSLEVQSPMEAPPLEHIIFALANLPLLESFKCTTSYAHPAGVTSTPCTVVVDLPRLANLEIRSGLPSCVFLLDHITYPETTWVMVSCSVMLMFEQHTSNVSWAQGLANDLIRRARKPIHSLDVQEDAMTVATSHDGIRYNRESQVELHFDFTSTRQSIVDIAVGIIQALPTLEHTETLVVEGISLPKETWINHFRALSRVKELRVGHDCPGFLKAFSDSSWARPGQFDHADHLAFEALRELTISRWMFDETYDYFEDWTGKSGPRSCVDRLSDGLEARQEAGMALEKLVLDKCRRVDEVSVAELRKFVKHLEWDEDPRWTASDEEYDEY